MSVVRIGVIAVGVVGYASSNTVMETFVVPTFLMSPLVVPLCELVTFPSVLTFLRILSLSVRLFPCLVRRPSLLNDTG